MAPAHRGKFVAYYRVSTDRQGESGLGLIAQRKAVRDYLDGGSWQLIGEHVEVESGRSPTGPNLPRRSRPAGAIGPSWSSPSSTAYPAIWPSSPR